MFWILLLFLRTVQSSNVVPNTPTAGTVVSVDQPYDITWNPSDASIAKSVFISLVNTDFATNLTVSTKNNGSYTWIPSVILGGQDNYFIQICPIDDSQDSCGVTFAGRFSIAAASSSSSTSQNTIVSSLPTTSIAVVSFSSSISQSTTISSSSTFTSSHSTTLQSLSSIQTSTPLKTLTSPQAPTPPTQSSGIKTNTSHGVSVGVVIAIAIVIPIFLIAVASTMAFVLWKKYKAKQMITRPSGSDGAAAVRDYGKAELAGTSKNADMTAELPDTSAVANRI